MKIAIDKIKVEFIKRVRENTLTIGLTLAFLLFHSLFEKYINKIIVAPFLDKVNSELLNDLIFGVLLVVIAINFLIKFQKNYKVTFKTFFQFLVVLFIYVYYRLWAEVWNFTGFSFANAFKYLDIIALYFSGNILLFIFNRSKNNNPIADKGFYLDTSLGEKGPDLLNRESLAKYICGEIKETESPDSSFAIGISSEWGFGKTSFFDLIERHLEKNTNIIIKVNPWINHESKSIVKDFFNALSSKLSEYNSDISPQLKKYAELLVGIGNSNLNKLLNPLLKNYAQNSTTLSEFEQINKAIKGLDKRLIIFIDDLDRLYKEEIIQVIKLIRNSANFGNTVFIVAYDRNYVINAIKEINNYNPEFFLEKIFQLEIRLPNFESQIIQKRIFDLLSPRISKSDKTELLDLLLNKKSSSDKNVFNSGSLTTLRDATRFSNSFLVAYSYLKGEVVLSDLLNLEVLRLKYPGVYKLIFFNSEEYLEAVSNTNNKTQYALSKEKDKDGESTDVILIRQFLLNNNEKVGIQKSDIDNAIGLLYSLFPDVDHIFHRRNVNHLSVSNPSSFERYSHYRLLDSNLSEIEFSQYRSKPLKEFCTKVEEWVNKGLRWELKRRFESINTYSDKADFEKIINAIVFFARLPKVPTIENDYSGFDFENLYGKLNKVEEYLKINYYSNKSEYKNFVLEIFKNAPSPYYFDIDFIYSCLYKYSNSYNFIIPKEDFEAIRLDYLKKYLKIAQNFDSNVWHLYHKSKLIEAVPQGGNAYNIHKRKNPDATTLVIDFIKEVSLDDFLCEVIVNEPFGGGLFAVSDVIPKIFGHFNAFGDFLEEFNEADYQYLKEFKEFYSNFKEVDYGSYIKFNFKVIPIDKKQ